jgi:hypothetical protein
MQKFKLVPTNALVSDYPACWKDIHAEIYGWTPSKDEVVVNAGRFQLLSNMSLHGLV